MTFDDLRAQLAFEERLYADLSEDLTLRELSEGAWYIEDLFGEEPETYMRAEGDRLPGNVFLNRPDDYGLWIVDGDLIVEKALCLSVWDMTNVVIVTGDLEAEGLVLDAEVHFYVLGATTLSGPLIANLSDAGYASFRGPARAMGWFEPGSGETVFNSGGPNLEEMLDDEFLEYEELLERLGSGGAL